jgi:hypothetical protein
VVACVDLFHSTDFPTLCERDASSEACAKPIDTTADARSDAGTPTDFCAWDSTQARKNAEHACAWLGACAGSMGDNALGPCMFRALQVYDCSVNPTRRVRSGAMHDVWDCLWKATTCEAVKRCILPTALPCTGAGVYKACAPGGARVFCEGKDLPPSQMESCAGESRSCLTLSASEATCAGKGGAACAANRCDGTHLEVCDGGLDRGVDCASFGEGTCTTSTGGSGCKPVATSAACAAGNVIRCDSGVASGCPLGVEERVDCNALSAGQCIPNVGGRTDDLARACAVVDAGCAEECSPGGGDTATGCFQGQSFTIECGEQQLKPCEMKRDDTGTLRPSCGAPL